MRQQGARGAGLALACLALAGNCLATETDDFTTLYSRLADAAPVLNAETNRLIDAALAELNRDAEDWGAADRVVPDHCSEPALYEAIADKLGGAVVGRLETFARNSDAIDRQLVERRASIYRDFGMFETPSLGGSEGRLAPTLQVGNFRFGADKLGHFIDQGYVYFSLAYLDAAGVEQAQRYGENTERTYFGALLTGVYSYADLAANFQGMRFFTDLLGRYPDPVTGKKTTQPYVRCVNQQWTRVRDFDWRHYADLAWNEASNCSQFRNPELAGRVKRLLVDMQSQEQRPYNCPAVRMNAIAERAHYGSWFDRVVNPSGHGAIDPPLADFSAPVPILQLTRPAQGTGASNSSR